jgi:glycosyltransferase involved in cell wall biosynthesis
MRILLIQNATFLPGHGGASKSNRLLLQSLAARGHRCVVVSPGIGAQGPDDRQALEAALRVRGIQMRTAADGHGQYDWHGIDVRVCVGPAMLFDAIAPVCAAYDPDWVLVSSEDVGQALLEAALAARPGRVVYLARTTVNLPCGPDSMHPSARGTTLLRRCAAIVGISRFISEYIERWAGVAARTLPLSLIEQPADRARDARPASAARHCVTMINPCAIKGIAIFLALARLHPDVSFAAVPTWGTTDEDRAALMALPNVALWAADDDIGGIFARTRVTLMPSLWAEALGRTILESLVHGVPVLASDIGGIREAMLGLDYVLPVRPILRYERMRDARMVPTAVVPEQDVRPWSDALQRLLVDDAHYEALAELSHARASAYLASFDIGPFESFLMQLTPAASSPAVQRATMPS